MTAQTLSAVAIHIADQYGNAGKHLNQAWRHGAARLVDGATARYAGFVQARSIPLMNDRLKTDLIEAQQLLAGFVLKGVHAGSERAAAAIDAVNTRATSGIEAIAAAAGRVEAALDVKASPTLRTLNMPAASLAAEVADRIAKGAHAVERRVGAPAAAAAEVVAAKPARRTARRA